MLETIANLIVDWMYRQYQRLGLWSFAILAAVVILPGLLVVRGCARAGKPKDSQVKAVEDQMRREAAADAEEYRAIKAREAKQTDDLAIQAAKARATVPPAKSPAVAATPPAPKALLPPPKPVHPANFADWKKDDFLAARAEGDPRLPGAIVDFAKRFQGNPAAADFVTSLLQDPGSPGRDRGLLASQAKPVAEAVVAALAANGTEPAAATLKAIVNGKLPTPDDQAAAAAALGALAARGDPDAEALLFAALTMPEEIRPPGGPVGPRELQQLAAATVRSSGSESLRLRLARHLVHPDTLPSVRQQFIGCIEDARIENLAAQTVLYASEEVDPKIRGVFERRFAAWSAEALARVVGLPASQTTTAPGTAGAVPAGPVRPGWASVARPSNDPMIALSASPASPVNPVDTLRYLWTDEFADILDRRMALAEWLGEMPGTLTLAVTVPTPAARAAIHRTLSKHWYEGPGGTEANSAWAVAVTDPGLVLVLKTLPRKGISSRPPQHPVHPIAKKGPTTSAVTLAKTANVIKFQREVAEQWWIRRVELLVRNWCARYRRTALAARGAEPGTSSSDVASELPMPLCSRAHPTAVYHCRWPGRLAEKVPAAARDPLDIYYVRMEAKCRPDHVRDYYRRQFESLEQRPAERGMWLDCLESGSQPDRKRSIDIVVSKAVPGVPTLGDEEQELVIEILWIEAKDPSLRSEGT